MPHQGDVTRKDVLEQKDIPQVRWEKNQTEQWFPFNFSFKKMSTEQIGVYIVCRSEADLKKLYDKIVKNENVMEFCEFSEAAVKLIKSASVNMTVLKFKLDVPGSLQQETARRAVVDFFVGELGGTPEGNLSME